MVKKKDKRWVRWSKDELRVLKRLFPVGKARQVADKVGRSLSTVKQKAYSMGLATRENRRWKVSEIKIVRTRFLTTDTQKLADRLGRTVLAVIARAGSMGIRKTKPASPPWSKKEEALLKKLYPNKENTTAKIAKQIGRSVAAIIGRAHRLGIRRKNPLWSKKEVALLRKMCLTHEDKEIGAKIGRSAGAVAIKRFKLGLKKRGVSGL